MNYFIIYYYIYKNKSHPLINIFLKILISDVQNNTYIKINSCNVGIQKSVRCNIKIQLINTTNLIQEYKNKKILRMTFKKKHPTII
jgi:hypothetical protein